MAHQCTSIALDSATQLSQSLTATNVGDNIGQVSAANAFADLGGGYAEFDVVIDWTTIDVSSTNETYEFRLEGSTTSAFSTKYILGRLQVGRAAATGQPIATPANGRAVMHMNNLAHTSATWSGQQDPMRYVQINCVAGGTTPSITFQAFLTARQ